RSPFLPTHVNVSPSTRNAEFSIDALPSPTIRRAPSNSVVRVSPRWRPSSAAPNRTTAHASTHRRSETLLVDMHGSIPRHSADYMGRAVEVECLLRAAEGELDRPIVPALSTVVGCVQPI